MIIPIRKSWCVFAGIVLFLNVERLPAADGTAEAVREPAIERCLKILRFGDTHSTYKPTKSEAVLALGLLGAKEAIPVLIEHLTGEQDDHLRLQIVRALGWIRDADAVPALKAAALHERYLYVRKAAAAALTEITGIEHEYDHTGEADMRKRILERMEAGMLEIEKKANKVPEPNRL